jgi:hypothetical protein
MDAHPYPADAEILQSFNVVRIRRRSSFLG